MAPASLPADSRSGVYQILCLPTGKTYVGSAKRFFQRWKAHLQGLKRGTHHSRRLQAAWLKYGAEAFEFSVLIICSASDAVLYEQIALDALAPEFNSAPKAGSTLGVKWSDEAKERIRASRPNDHFAGRKHTPETLETMAAARRGKPSSTKGKPKDQAAVLATAAAHRGMKRSPETCAKIAAKAKGRRWSEEAKAKVSATLTGRPISEQARAKLIGNKHAAGRVQTPEERANRSEKLRAAWAAKKAAGIPWR